MYGRWSESVVRGAHLIAIRTSHTATARTINGTRCGVGVYIVKNRPFANLRRSKTGVG